MELEGFCEVIEDSSGWELGTSKHRTVFEFFRVGGLGVLLSWDSR